MGLTHRFLLSAAASASSTTTGAVIAAAAYDTVTVQSVAVAAILRALGRLAAVAVGENDVVHLHGVCESHGAVNDIIVGALQIDVAALCAGSSRRKSRAGRRSECSLSSRLSDGGISCLGVYTEDTTVGLSS